MRFKISFFLFSLLFFLPTSIIAGDPISDSFTIASEIGYGALGTSPIQDVIVSIINVVLSFTSIIFIAIIIYGGVLYATSHVNEEHRDYAIATLKSGIVGMAFIIFSMSISKFVLSSVSTATGGALTF